MKQNMYFFFGKAGQTRLKRYIATYPTGSTPDPYLPDDPKEQIVIRVPDDNVTFLFRSVSDNEEIGFSDWMIKLCKRGKDAFDPEFTGLDRCGIITCEWDAELEIDSDRYLGTYVKAVERLISQVTNIVDQIPFERAEFDLHYGRLVHWLEVSGEAGLTNAEHVRLSKRITTLAQLVQQRRLITSLERMAA